MTQSCLHINFWDYSHRAQFEPPPPASDRNIEPTDHAPDGAGRYRGTSLIRKSNPPGPYRRPCRGHRGVGVFLWARCPCHHTPAQPTSRPVLTGCTDCHRLEMILWCCGESLDLVERFSATPTTPSHAYQKSTLVSKVKRGLTSETAISQGGSTFISQNGFIT